MPNVTLVCDVCDHRDKRALMDQVACRGFRETACEPARCPRGHGEMTRRADGMVQAMTEYGVQVIGRVTDHPMRAWNYLMYKLGARK